MVNVAGAAKKTRKGCKRSAAKKEKKRRSTHSKKLGSNQSVLARARHGRVKLSGLDKVIIIQNEMVKPLV